MQIRVVFFCICVLFLYSCGPKDTKAGPKGSVVAATAPSKQLNISILWDLSDRVDPRVNPASPEHYQRDIEIIKTFTEAFKQDMNSKGAYSAKGKIKVFFTPTPQNNDINNLAKNLSKDLSIYQDESASREKKKVYDLITKDFEQNAQRIYELTLESNKGKASWDGSDIWRFFKNDVDQCIESDTNYRNILVILTDGYIYHKDSREKQGNRSQFILPASFKPFRGNSKWQEEFQRNDYGLSTTRNDLDRLEVLVLEITPSKENKNDEDYIKAYLSKWFEEMGIKKSKVYNSDLPEYTKKRIESFLSARN